jgi:hypothetical protein
MLFLEKFKQLYPRLHRGDQAPLDFVPASWRPMVCPQEGVVDRAVTARALKNRLPQMIQRRHPSDLLLEVQGWTNFLGAFTRLNSGRPITEADTAEQDLIFGVTHLLGIRFAPRIKDLPEQRLWRLPEGEAARRW